VSTPTTLEHQPPQPERPEQSGTRRFESSVTSYLGQNMRQYGMVVALVVIVALFQILTDGRLLYPNNIAALVQQNAYVLILAIGMVIVIVAGHIDLSVGSVVAFIGGECALLMSRHDMPWPVAVLAAIVLGGLVGCWQGFWVAYVGIPAFIVTLGGMLLFRGLAIDQVGETVASLPTAFNAISNDSLPNSLGFIGNLDGMTLLVGLLAIAGLLFSQLRARLALLRAGLHVEPVVAFAAKLVFSVAAIGYITYLLANSTGGTPIVLVIVGVLVILYSYLMANTVVGRHVYAMGGNLAAAKLSGVNTRRVNFLIFVNIGILAGIAAVVTTSRAGAAVAAAGTNYELDAIAAAFIGGTAVTGGIGKVVGAIIGAFIMGVLNMGLSIMNVDPAWQMAVKGLVLIVAVAFDILNKRRSAATI
jgi:putative multiple sugar transport system permease protein